MEIRQLMYFISVAEHLNFTEAAKKLFVAQPAVSQQIARLEKELGFKLFTRTRHSVQLTSAGKVFLKDAIDIVNRAQEAIKKGQKAELGEVGELHLAFLNAPARKFLPKLIKKFRKEHPQIQLHLKRYQSGQILELLRNDEIDLAITMSLGLQFDDMEYETLYSESACLIVSEDHPLADRKVVQISELAHEDFVFIDRKQSPHRHDHLLALLTKFGLSPNIVDQAERIDTVLLMVEAGLGITVLPKHLILYATPALRFIEIDTGTDDLMIDIVAAWKKTNLNPTIPLFLKELRAIDFEKINP